MPHKLPFDAPMLVEIRPKREGLQCILLEAAGFPVVVPALMNRIQFDPQVRRSLTQWRLDYPSPSYATYNEQNKTILAVLEKILLRGGVTFVSPIVEEVVTNLVLKNEEIDDSRWEEALRQVGYFTKTSYRHHSFDSKEEAILYNEILPQLAPDRNIYAWTTPQVSTAFLANGLLDSETKQRADFFIAHPNGTQIILEVDGSQHEESREADERRDYLLQVSGIKVFRIPVSEIHAKAGGKLSALKRMLESIPPHEYEKPLSPPTMAILLDRAASQLQVALLQALKAGHVKINEAHTNKWKIIIPSPSWCHDNQIWIRLTHAAVDDFIDLIKAVFRIHRGMDIDLSINMVQKSRGEIDLAILFEEEYYKDRHARVILEINNIYLPHSIEHTLAISPAVVALHPEYHEAEYLLNFIFRKKNFWEGQWEAISRALQGWDSIVLLPTGGGKSIAFQLASLLRPGPCLVIDPLISLIEDQLDNLRSLGIDRVVGISSQISFQEKTVALRSFSHGHYLFCYVAPERLQMEDFRESLRAITTGSPVSLIAVDEVHCVSEWGHDFRTSYLNVARNAWTYCEHDGNIPPLMGLTGTASRSVLKDVQRELGIESFDAIVTPRSFDRPELNFRVVQCRSSEKEARLKGYIASLPQEFRQSRNVFFQPRGVNTMAGLIFYPHVNGELGVTGGYQILEDEIGSVAIYSGQPPKGTSNDRWDELKMAFARRFKHNEVIILVCTNAFGMGIDMPNIRYTVHMNLPRSIEAFYQEAGRAGRNRSKSECCLIVSND